MKHLDLPFVNSLSLSPSVCRQQNITIFGGELICTSHPEIRRVVVATVALPQVLSYNESTKIWIYIAEYGSELESAHNAYLWSSLIEESYIDGGRWCTK